MSDDGETAEYPVLSDEPIVVPRPRRAVARVAIAYMLAILIVGASAAYIGATVGYNRSAERTDRRIATLERDLADRRAARARDDATRDAQVGRLRQLVCLFADRVQPRDAEVERARAEFGCTYTPPVPQAVPSAMPEPGPRGDGRQTPGQPGPAPSRSRSGGQPNPTPQPPANPPVQPQPPGPPDEPEPEPDDGLICLPILGCLL